MFFAMAVVLVTILILTSVVIYRENKTFKANARRTTEFIAQTIGERILSLLIENEYQESGKIVKAILHTEKRILAIRIREKTNIGLMNVLYVKTDDFDESEFSKPAGFTDDFFHYNYELKLGDEIKGDIQIFFSLSEMRENIKKFNIMVFAILIVCLVIAFILSTFLSNFMVRPIKNFTVSAQKIASGNLSEKIIIKNKDEIGDLAHSFEIMREKIKNHIDELDQKVIERTQAITDLLDNAGQGFLSFNTDLIIFKEYSKQCIEIFGRKIEGMNIIELLFKEEWEQYKNEPDSIPKGTQMYLMREGFKTCFDTGRPVVLKILPKEFPYGDKMLSLKYALLVNQKNEKKIMLIVTDITSEKKLEEKAHFEEERNKFIVKVALDKKSFIIFIKDLNNILKKLQNLIDHETLDTEKIKYIFRLVHTIKGNSSFYNLTKVVKNAHIMEDYLYEIQYKENNEINTVEINRYLDNIYVSLNESLDIINDFLSKDEILKDEKIFEVSETKINNLIQILAHLNLFEKEKDYIIKQIKDIKKIPIKHILKRFVVNAEQLARTLQKEIEPIAIKNEDLKIDYYYLRPAIDTFVHLIRNSVDHGIEQPFIREKLGKPRAGRIVISIDEKNIENKKYFEFILSDDGKGIDLVAIKKALADKKNIKPEKLAEMSDKDIMMSIFEDGISSKNEVSELSGRGVGMSAVREMVYKFNGSINVESTTDKGSVFKILIPTL